MHPDQPLWRLHWLCGKLQDLKLSRPCDILRILRTIDSFAPDQQGPAHQAWQISNRLEQKGIRSPLLTTASHSNDSGLKKERLGQVQVTRVPLQWKLGSYKISFGMMTYLRRYHILHSHLYRTFQTDCAFFLRPSGRSRLC